MSTSDPLLFERARLISAAFLVLLVGAFAAPASAAELYVSKSGSDANPGTEQEPFATISQGVGAVGAGDTLRIDDGTYRESVTISRRATEDEPITIEAINDGAVTVDAQGSGTPLLISGEHIVVEGLVCRNSNRNVVTVSGNHNTVRRVSAYRSRYGHNDHGFAVTGSHNLIEDTVAASVERHLYMAWSGSGGARGNVFRRTFAYGAQLPDTPKPSASEFNIYGASETIVENSIGWGGSDAKSLSIHSAWDGAPDDVYYKYESMDNEVLGSILRGSNSWGMTIGYGHRSFGSVLENNVVIDNSGGGIALHEGTGGTDEILRNNTIIGNDGAGIQLFGGPDVAIQNELIFDNAAGFDGASPTSLTYSNSFGNGSNQWPSNRGEGCIEEDPELPEEGLPLSIPEDSPCKGAGASGADIGANLYYRYEDGELTDEPLWPWPMAERIEDELGIDVMDELGPVVPGFHASMTAAPTAGTAPLEVEFSTTVGGGEEPYSYEWDFGDGSETSSEEEPTHTYESAGSHEVVVQVTDADKEIAEATAVIDVDRERRLGAPRIGSAPTLDGEIDAGEWGDAEVFAFAPQEASSANEAAARAVWGDEHLYLAVEVSDPDLITDSDQMLFERDGVELFFDPEFDRSEERLADDLKWIVTAGGDVELSTVDNGYWSATDDPSGVDAAVAATGDGYVVETQISWTRLGASPTEGLELGFEPTNNDEQPEGDAIHYTWSGGPPGPPADWGVLQLLSDEGETGPSDDAGTADAGDGSPGADEDEGRDAGSGADNESAADAGASGGCAIRSRAATSPFAPLTFALAMLTLAAGAGRRR